MLRTVLAMLTLVAACLMPARAADTEFKDVLISLAGPSFGLIAAIHFYILVLEMFLWQTPRGMKTFGTDPAFAARSATAAGRRGSGRWRYAPRWGRAGRAWSDSSSASFLARVASRTAYSASPIAERARGMAALTLLSSVSTTPCCRIWTPRTGLCPRPVSRG